MGGTFTQKTRVRNTISGEGALKHAAKRTLVFCVSFAECQDTEDGLGLRTGPAREFLEGGGSPGWGCRPLPR